MNDLKIFENTEFGQVRTVTKENEVWFVAADVCRALGLDQVTNIVRRLDDDERTLIEIKGASNGLPVNGVNEPGLYKLIFTSNKPEAKKFKRWVTHEVLPSIRRQGYYSAIPDEVLLEAVKNKLLLEGESFQPGLDQIKAELTDARWEQMRELWEEHEAGDFTGVEQNIKEIWKEDKAGCAKARNHFWRLVRDGGLVGYDSLKWSRPIERRYNGRRPKELDDPAVLDHLTEQYKDMLLSEYRKYYEMAKEVPFLEARLKIANKEIERLQGAICSVK